MDRPQNHDALNLIVNPYIVISLKDELFEDHSIEGALEDWVSKNAELMNEIGAHDWLDELLHSLGGTRKPDYVRDTIISPFKGLVFSPNLKGQHEPIIDRDTWLSANEKAINEIGTEQWLWALAKVLQTGGLAS